MKNICGFLLKNDEAKQMLQSRALRHREQLFARSPACLAHYLQSCKPSLGQVLSQDEALLPWELCTCNWDQDLATSVLSWRKKHNPCYINSCRCADKPGPSITSLPAALTFPAGVQLTELLCAFQQDTEQHNTKWHCLLTSRIRWHKHRDLVLLPRQSPLNHQLTPENSAVLPLWGAQGTLRLWPSSGWRGSVFIGLLQHKDFDPHPAQGSQRPQPEQGSPTTRERVPGCCPSRPAPEQGTPCTPRAPSGPSPGSFVP